MTKSNLRRLIAAWVVAGWAASVSSLAQTDLPVYADAWAAGWENWSWAATRTSTSPVHGGAASLAVTADAWETAYFHHAALDATLFTNLVFWVHGGSAGGQRLLVQGTLAGVAKSATNLPPLAANSWQQVVIPLTALGVADSPDFDGFWIQDRSGTTQAEFFLDDMVLRGIPAVTPGTNAPLAVTVDAGLDRHPISPLIYGVAFASAAQVAELNVPLHRSGGNSESRYNWQLNAHNRAADWYFESLPDSPATAGAAGDNFVNASRSGGAEPMLTIPMAGWVPKLGPNRGRLASFSIAKYGAQSGSDWQWFPDAGNGLRASDNRPITWNDPHDANLPADELFQRGWLEHLTNRWGRAAQGGVKYYFVDNEPSLWHSTHRDVHPAGAGMEEVRDKFLACAAMIKAVDPDALVAAPEEWGWSGYFYSGLDQQSGSTNGWSYFPDRAAHGGWDYLPWFLKEVRNREVALGRRLLDLFTVHYYPQGGEFSTDVSAAMQLRRNRSTRALWDTQYVDPTWINDKVMLIPRLKSWVNTYCPGIRIGLTEYNWGAEEHISGALAQADLLGIFGREGLDLATRWTTPDTDTPTFLAMRMYRNYDGAKSTFGDIGVRTGGPNPDELAAFAAERSTDGALTVMLVHKRLAGASPLTLTLSQFAAGGAAQVWRLQSDRGLTRLPDAPLSHGQFADLLPAQSLTLLVIPAVAPPRLAPGALLPDGTLTLSLRGSVGVRYRIEHTANFGLWSPVRTNVGTGAPETFNVETAPAPAGFFRAVSLP